MKKWMLFLFVFSWLSWTVSIALAVDPHPAQPEAKPVQVEGEKGAEEGAEVSEQKPEQHAPTIEVGDTKKFIRQNPLTAPKEEEEFEY